MVDANDEFMHDPGPHRVWQESFFFSWFDAESDAVGLARIGYRPSNHTADALLYTMRNGRVEGGYARLNARYSGTPDPGRLQRGGSGISHERTDVEVAAIAAGPRRGGPDMDCAARAVRFSRRSASRAVPAARNRRCAHGAVRMGHRHREDERGDLRD